MEKAMQDGKATWQLAAKDFMEFAELTACCHIVCRYFVTVVHTLSKHLF